MWHTTLLKSNLKVLFQHVLLISVYFSSLLGFCRGISDMKWTESLKLETEHSLRYGLRLWRLDWLASHFWILKIANFSAKVMVLFVIVHGCKLGSHSGPSVNNHESNLDCHMWVHSHEQTPGVWHTCLTGVSEKVRRFHPMRALDPKTVLTILTFGHCGKIYCYQGLAATHFHAETKLRVVSCNLGFDASWYHDGSNIPVSYLERQTAPGAEV